MPKVIFIDAPTTPQDRIGALSSIIDLSRDRPHLGILILAALARENGWETAVIDPYPFQWSDEEICRQVEEFGPDVIGISAHTLGIANGNRLAQFLKSKLPGVPIVVGGPHSTSLQRETLENYPGYDISVTGEAEGTLMELLDLLITNPSEDDLRSVKGIAFRGTDGDVIITELREPIEDLDALPMPAWDLLPEYPFKYSPSLSSGAGTKPTGSLFTTRGCPSRCIFCDRGVFGGDLRVFSADYVMKQILHLYNEYDIRELMFGDDTLFADKQRMRELAQLLIDAKLDLRWECMARIIDIDEEMCALAKRAGCFEISYGIESIDPKIAPLISKPISREIAERAIRITKEAGVRARGYFIFGLPGDTEETLKATSDFIINSDLDDVAIFACTPYPGSALYARTSEFGTFDRDWGKMNNVETVFVPYGLTAEFINDIRMKTMRKFYLNPAFIYHWTKSFIRQHGWRELGRKCHIYVHFFPRMLAEFVSGLGRGA